MGRPSSLGCSSFFLVCLELLAVAATAASSVACGGSGTTSVPNGPGPDASAIVPVVGEDGGSIPEDANTPVTPPTDAGQSIDAQPPPNPADGPPVRQACTGNFGNALSAQHGRLDGTLVAIVQPHSNQSCNSDSHVHLQVLMGGSVYDVATNLQTYFYTQDLPLPDGAWSDGWHAGDGLNYATLGIHSTQFTQPANEAALAATVTTALENANHISVFATGYGTTGVHDVHRRGGGGVDGAIFIDPLSPKAHGLFFCFNTDNF